MLLLTESDVASLLSMPDAMDAVEAALRDNAMAGDGTTNQPRRRIFLPAGVLHHMAAAWPAKGVMGTKTYTSFAGGTRFYVLLFSTEAGELLALIEADRLGQIRTGAATGVAAKWLALPDATEATLLGTGWQARSQAEALTIACPTLQRFHVYGRDADRRARFGAEMSEQLKREFVPADDIETAVRSSPILVCATSATQPIVRGEWLRAGHFVSAVGANRLSSREIDEATVARAAIVAVDDVVQAHTEAAELIFAHERRKLVWERVYPLGDIIAGVRPGRVDRSDITLFKSLGIALEDVAVAAIVYERAQAGGVGRVGFDAAPAAE